MNKISKPSYLKIQSSPIAGNGVFTTKDLEKDQTICFLEGELCSLEEILRRIDTGEEDTADPLQIEDTKYLDLDEISRTFNHSCKPNSYIRGKSELVALRNIPTNEEITYDYSTTMNDNEAKIKNEGFAIWSCACNCGSSSCRGVIDQFKTLPRKIRSYYLDNGLGPDFIRARFSPEGK